MENIRKEGKIMETIAFIFTFIIFIIGILTFVAGFIIFVISEEGRRSGTKLIAIGFFVILIGIYLLLVINLKDFDAGMLL
ncbi:MAG: hypothetical protein HFI48_16745 [Lachnospiraceae bacterium]|nr:hypothetical protein [Lachnospiraceae bacterium]